MTAADPVPSVRLSLAELRAAQAAVAAVAVTDATIDALIDIRAACAAEGIIASDRRWKRSLKLVQAATFLAGEKATSPEDLTVLIDALWRTPAEVPKVARIVGRLADPASTQAQAVIDAARELCHKATALKCTDRRGFVAAAAQAIEAFGQQQKKLVELAATGGRRARAVVSDAAIEIEAMHRQLAAGVSTGLGLRSVR
jgi:MoxR-like ATPase